MKIYEVLKISANHAVKAKEPKAEKLPSPRIIKPVKPKLPSTPKEAHIKTLKNWIETAQGQLKKTREINRFNRGQQAIHLY